MRNNLILRLACSECGNALNARYGAPGDREVNQNSFASANDPTGGFARYTECVQIDPCRSCIERHTKPAIALANAVRQLNEPHP